MYRCVCVTGALPKCIQKVRVLCVCNNVFRVMLRNCIYITYTVWGPSWTRSIQPTHIYFLLDYLYSKVQHNVFLYIDTNIEPKLLFSAKFYGCFGSKFKFQTYHVEQCAHFTISSLICSVYWTCKCTKYVTFVFLKGTNRSLIPNKYTKYFLFNFIAYLLPYII